MINLIRTTSNNNDFINLVKELDRYLVVMDGEEHDFYDQYNKLHNIKYVIVAYKNNEPVGCGAIKEFEEGIFEVKRMYISPKARKLGIASSILERLEDWARELKADKCILETGHRQVEAVHLYRKRNYQEIPNYGQYEGMENSICFQKEL